MIKAGVATGNQVQEIFKHAKANAYALPAVNVVNTIPIMEPSKDLLGLNLGKIFVFPNFFPPRYAIISFILNKHINKQRKFKLPNFSKI